MKPQLRFDLLVPLGGCVLQFCTHPTVVTKCPKNWWHMTQLKKVQKIGASKYDDYLCLQSTRDKQDYEPPE